MTALWGALERDALTGIAIALALGAASPGPSFLLVAKIAASSKRRNGLSAALGMGCGGVIFAALSLVGITAFAGMVPTLYPLIKIAGGIYLVYLGVRMWTAARMPGTHDTSGESRSYPFKSFVISLATQLSNPKTAVVYASVFAAFLPTTTDLRFKLLVLLLVLTIETGWYALVALLLSGSAMRQRYLQFRTWIDRGAGGVMLLLGIRLAVSK